ncbi:hypothetical protein [Streptomyces sp. NBC_00133]|uniref:hypothetical protein n=1 Tax=Streptomyces sp. NBC_00133 TaxID=2903624 RepID=UPI00386D0934
MEHEDLPAQERQRLGWIMHARRNCRDYERLPEVSEAHLTWALITLMTRRLTRGSCRRRRTRNHPA